MSDFTAVNSIAGGGQPDMTDAAQVVLRAEELLAQGEYRTAREIVREALGAFGRRADLLWILAEAEFACSDTIAGRQ